MDRGLDYSGFERALGLGSAEALRELLEAEPTGAAGSPALIAERWRRCRDAEAAEKYVVCSAVDADPRARSARVLLGSDPRSVLEGVLIAAYVVGAAQCFVCTNVEYGEEIALTETVLEQMRREGLLGEDIRGSGFACEISVRPIPSSLFAGEETALLRALEGKPPLPELTLDDPALSGLNGRPTLIVSAESLAGLSATIGGQAGATGIGERLLTVSGDVEHESTVRASFGATIAAILEEACGAPLDGLGIKAVQLGGPTGPFFASGDLDTSLTYELVAGAGLGSGSMHVFGDARRAVEMVRDLMLYLQDQSCGECVFCREGTRQLAILLDRIARGQAESEDMELVLELCEAMKSGSICTVGKTASIPVLSSLERFGDEWGTG